MRVLSRNISFRSFLTAGPYEQEPEFKQLLESIARYGLLIAGMLGSLVIIFFVSSHILLLGEEIVWLYSDTNAQNEIMLWDKSFIFLLCIACLLFSQTSITLFWSRLLMAFFVWISCLAILLDDIVSRDITFSTAYLILVLVLAVGTMPYKGWQISGLALCVIITTQVTISISQQLIGIAAIGPQPGQLIYLFLMTILLTGLSSLIYLNRFEQFQARKRVEELKEALKQRAKILEVLKEKSERQAEQLLENERLKDRFFANISHEFRTPLTIILGPLKDVLESDSEDISGKVGRETVKLMYRNGQRLLELINQLLDLSKIDSGNIKLDLRQVELRAFVSNKVESFIPLAESRNIDLNCIAGEKEIISRIDPHQMERVVGNLVSNAIKFTPQGGRVSVSILEQDDRVEIRVKDTGIGIAEYDLPNIFDRFYQGVQSGNEKHSGTGIGLALSREIAELHGGDIVVKSRPGEGSEFIVGLYDYFINKEPATDSYEPYSQLHHDPILFSEGINVWEKKDTDGHSSEDAQTVLLVDDNPDILLYLYPRLSQRYNVVAKERSKEALEVIKTDFPDLVISDIMMPEPDGYELCRFIKESPELNHIPVILLTALAEEEKRIEGLEFGADDYISKPFSAEELLVRIENLLELRQILRNKYSEQIRLEGKKIEVTPEDARFLKEVQAVIEEHIEDRNFSVDWLAGEVNLSARQLQRKIRSITDLSAGGYIRMIRLERACQLLSQQWGNISEISYKVGFQDTKYFSRLFKQAFGVPPSEYVE